MKDTSKEFITINVLLVFILLMLSVFTIADNNAALVSASSAAIYKVDTHEKKIAIMCNVYEGAEFVEQYAALFAKSNAHATFFLGGTFVKANQELVKALYAGGFELGNHGYAHRLPTRISKNEVRQEILQTDTLVQELTGYKMKVYAPPSGDYNKDTLAVAAGLGYTTIMWSIDTIDWRDKDSAKVQDRILKNLKPGAFILIHPTAHTLDALKILLPKLQQMGYQLLTVSEMMAIKNT